ncbi:DUF6303 family protein [Streptomyces sp. NPDC059708]|uniref:DUF6303 family protein n=1 Tax=Streptomyces sp. NPDC059708 TaxID=3346916 RepID=UPI0036B67740
MDDPIDAYLWQHPGGSWGLWVADEASGQPQTTLPPTEPGTLPGPGARAQALAFLGYQPAATGWAWEEVPEGLNSRLVGITTVREER